ncbi:MAG: penicillin-binding protein activator [Smithellaceae bacterium]|nr:penicillin-binding protein activator [Smithellaceae bacterium]NLX52599.1 ABC transporter substrate-binding protein [Deltaproteobacteria bacterium]
MKRHVLLVAILLSVLLVGSAGCVKRAPAPQPPGAPPADKTVEEPRPAAAVPPPEVRPPEAKPPAVQPPPPATRVQRDTLGCILPLTGRFADAGTKALEAALLSAGIFRQGSASPWKIVVTDSGDTPEAMRKAVAYLADEAQVMAIIAVSGSGEAADAAAEAQQRKVPLLLITSREGVTDAGGYVFQHFLTPAQQMEAMAHYALNTLNVAIFAVLYPKDDYGKEMLSLFQNELAKVGGKVIRAVGYEKTQTDFAREIKEIAGGKFSSQDKVYAASSAARQKLSADFEALFIPDSPLRVKMIASQLAFYDIRDVKLLGTSLWHSPDLLKRGTEYLEGAIFVDSFLANGFYPETNDFVDIYYSAYRREPGNIEALAYDTTEIVLAVLEDPRITSREAFVEGLLAVQGFRGATGSTTFRGSRAARKTAFILKVQNGKVVQVK